jgi:hypothetical protein
MNFNFIFQDFKEKNGNFKLDDKFQEILSEMKLKSSKYFLETNSININLSSLIIIHISKRRKRRDDNRPIKPDKQLRIFLINS